MPKKKTINKNNPDALKEAGNKAYLAKNYNEAIKQYTAAIELSQNHIYYANRANAYLELENFEECIKDCVKAIEIEPSFPKSYYRKAKALINLERLTEALETLKVGLEIEPDNDIIKTLMDETAEEIEQDNKIPVDHPERKRF